MPNVKPTKTSFKKGNKRSVESIERQRATMIAIRKQKTWVSPLLGKKVSQETISKRTQTVKQRTLGKRTLKKNKKYTNYWLIRTEDGLRYEHRVIMEKKIGRKLLRSEHVHHKNHDGLDNREDNLELLTHSQHSAIHSREMLGKNFNFRRPSLKELNVWSLRFDKCLECQSTKSKHHAKGYCKLCTQKRFRRHSNNESKKAVDLPLN